VIQMRCLTGISISVLGDQVGDGASQKETPHVFVFLSGECDAILVFGERQSEITHNRFLRL
jgi:hypothetical protein